LPALLVLCDCGCLHKSYLTMADESKEVEKGIHQLSLSSISTTFQLSATHFVVHDLDQAIILWVDAVFAKTKLNFFVKHARTGEFARCYFTGPDGKGKGQTVDTSIFFLSLRNLIGNHTLSSVNEVPNGAQATGYQFHFWLSIGDDPPSQCIVVDFLTKQDIFKTCM
jgi:hypothetical protein